MSWLIDFPNPYDLEAPWIHYGSFETKEEAIRCLRLWCGADDDGRITLITHIPEDEDAASDVP